ncbi:hypothetical protein Celal_3501 [Cellulophaga algicola DSM 14237]|uniref:Uncharacterized protein n=1 Tax=Cellulophaga algicola (strain DSM 14237 / IC166 / ACAM 630) TaxID=688270 RepID=E6X7Q5_CELAD|nr:hypothetical protein [Cellulophaga algicola]ADV50765.1 hypothetical protein Celal_3501 [Cellulophaga algicola DSM 14237]
MITQEEKYCSDLLAFRKWKELTFHDLIHTQEVAEYVNYICCEMNSTPRKTELPMLTARFQNTGFLNSYNDYEEESKNRGIGYLNAAGMYYNSMVQICKCIDGTRWHQNPTTALAEILCDANIIHVNNAHFFYRNSLRDREREFFCDRHLTEEKCSVFNLEVLVNVHFKSHHEKGYVEVRNQKNLEDVKTNFSVL